LCLEKEQNYYANSVYFISLQFLRKRKKSEKKFLPEINQERINPLSKPTPLLWRGWGRLTPLLWRGWGRLTPILWRGWGRLTPLLWRGWGRLTPLLWRGWGRLSPSPSGRAEVGL
jgi:hypothetical protein